MGITLFEGRDCVVLLQLFAINSLVVDVDNPYMIEKNSPFSPHVIIRKYLTFRE